MENKTTFKMKLACYICKCRTITMFRLEIQQNSVNSVIKKYIICDKCKDKIISENIASYIISEPKLEKLIYTLIKYVNGGYKIILTQIE